MKLGPLIAGLNLLLQVMSAQTVVPVHQGGTGSTTSEAARTNLAAAALTHVHLITDLSGITGIQGTGTKVQMFAGSAPSPGYCAQFDASGNISVASAPCGSGGSSAVTSVFGRIGAVAALTGDYSFSLLSGLLDPNQIASANKNGTASKFQMFNGSQPSADHCAKFDSSGNLVSAGQPCGVPGGVITFNGRTGNVVPVTNDYSFSQLSSTLSFSQLNSSYLQGNGTKLQTFSTGTPNAGDCAQFDSNGSLVSSGIPCGSGGGGGYGLVYVGEGITGNGAAATPIRLDTSSVPTFLTATSVIDNWNSGSDNVPAQSCQEKSFTLNGAATGDAVLAGWPTTLPTNLAGMAYVSMANQVTVRLCNPTSGSISVTDGQTFRVTIIRSFN